MSKYTLGVTKSFKKDFNRCIKRGLPIVKIQEAMRLLEATGSLLQEYRPHKLVGKMPINGNVISMVSIATG